MARSARTAVRPRLALRLLALAVLAAHLALGAPHAALHADGAHEAPCPACLAPAMPAADTDALPRALPRLAVAVVVRRDEPRARGCERANGERGPPAS